MRQALHILRKDVRSLWSAITVVLALTTLFAWSQAKGTSPGIAPQFPNPFPEEARALIELLLVMSWLYLVSAAIYQEAPTGDRQFWTTRPYSWKSLVLARLLFNAGFINLPFLLSDLFILRTQQLPVTVGFLIWRQLSLLSLVVAPAAALAALTRHYSQIGLSVLAILVMFLLSSQVLGGFNKPWGPLAWVPASIFATVLFLSGFGVLLWQYWSRRTWVGWSIWMSAVGLCLATVCVPGVSAAVAFVSYFSDPVALRLIRLGDWRIENLPQDITARPGLVDVTARAEDGAVWHSGWQEVRTDAWPDLVWLAVDPQLPDRFRLQPLDVRIDVFMTAYQRRTTIPFRQGAGRVTIPGIGDCSIVSIYSTNIPTVLCRGLGNGKSEVDLNGSMIINESQGFGTLLALSPILQKGGQIQRGSSPVLTVKKPIAYLLRGFQLPHVRFEARHR